MPYIKWENFKKRRYEIIELDDWLENDENPDEKE